MIMKIIGSMIVSVSICAILCACSTSRAGKKETPSSPVQERITPDNAAGVTLLRSFQIPNYQRGDLSQCSLDFSPDGSLLVGACGNNPVPVWKVASGEIQFSLYQDHAVQVVSCAFNPDGTQIACGGFDNIITIWDASSGNPLKEFGANIAPIWELAYSPDGQRIVSADFSNEVRLWDIETGSLLWVSDDIRNALSVVYHPSGKMIAYGSRGPIRAGVLEPAGGRMLSSLTGPSHNVGDISFNPDGTLIAAGCDDLRIYLWKSIDFQRIATLTGHTDYVNGVAFSPAGSLLASGSHDKTVGIWDVTTHKPLIFLPGHEYPVLRVAFNPQGTLLASISWDGTVKLWGVISGR
jgi:WD40 repeat protein